MTSSVATYGDVYPSLTYDDAPAAVDWLCRAFGFTRRLVVPGPDATIRHSKLSFGAAVIMVSSPRPEVARVGPRNLRQLSQSVCIHVDDVDAHYVPATAAGAVILHELRDEESGARGYMTEDLEGHVWYFGTYRPGLHWGNVAPEKDADA